MIVVAVEHKGVENFIRDEVTHHPEYESVSIVHAWEEVEHLADRAHKILLGERVVRYVPTEKIVEVVQRRMGHGWVFWTTEGDRWSRVLGKNAEIWHKELGPEELREWLKSSHTLTPTVMPSRWFMWSTSGTSRRQLVWRSLISNMQTQYKEGILADFDWEQALVTRLWGQGFRDANYPFARLALGTASWGWVIPAPMPWMPVLYEPDTDDVKKALTRHANWMAWDLGLNIRRPLAALVIASLPAGVIYVQEEGNDETLHKGLALIQEFNPRCDLRLVGDSAAPLAGRLGLPLLTPTAQQVPITPSWGALRRWVNWPLKRSP
ncbi:MAG: hypothetical protein M1493_14895 [Firmicutes bacterium]|jgi:hypothetical protein|nr:hypothetical protein [Bacillota bacterium]